MGVAALREKAGSWRALGRLAAFLGEKKGILLQGMLQGWGCQVCACPSTWTRVYPTQCALYGSSDPSGKQVFGETFGNFEFVAILVVI